MAGLNLQNVSLPGYVREDLAWQDVVTVVGAVGVNDIRFKVPGEYVLYPTVVAARLSASAVVGNRLLLWRMIDPDGVAIYAVTAAAVQGASGVFDYTFALGVGAALVPNTAIQLMPLPSQILLPGYSASIFVSSMQAGDVAQMSIVGLKIPTGPPASSSTTFLPEPVKLAV